MREFSCPLRVSTKGGGATRSTEVEEVKDCSLRVQKGNTDWGNSLTATLMKKLLSLALIAVMAFVVGCKPAEETPPVAPGTNAPAAP